jgi:hypothetical protein
MRTGYLAIICRFQRLDGYMCRCRQLQFECPAFYSANRASEAESRPGQDVEPTDSHFESERSLRGPYQRYARLAQGLTLRLVPRNPGHILPDPVGTCEGSDSTMRSV